MTYEKLKEVNERNKKNNVFVRRLVAANSEYAVFDNLDKVKVDAVVLGILKGTICLSNISKLRNYNFEKGLFQSTKQKYLSNQTKKQANVQKNISIRNQVLKETNLLYHGSDDGIKDEIRVDKNRNNCDFGKGFYLGTKLIQAENRVSNSANAVLYAYTYDFSSVNIYEFKDAILWVLFICTFRRKNTIDLDKYMKLKNERAKILKSDVIIGWIADDKIATVYEYFIKGFITDICLFECLRLVDYGKQVVIKTEKGLNCIKEKYKYELLEGDKKKSIEWNKSKKKDIDNRIEELRIKYRGIGKYVDECLEGYK